MLQKQITPANADAEIRLLYETAFPQEEQIPWDDLVRLIDEMHLDFTAYYDNDILIGFTIVYPRPSFNWYWYFAVKEELRGKGLGQQILNQLIEKYKGQSGFRDTNVYRCWDDLEMTIMMMGPGTFTLQDWDEIVGELRKYWTWE